MQTGRDPTYAEILFFNVITEILFPVKQCLIVMQTEILDIQSMEIILCHMVQDLT